MKDRIPKYAGRIKLIPVANASNTYDVERADEPLQDGTPLNKNTMLRDETAEALKLPQEDPTPDDAFVKIALELEKSTDQIATLLVDASGYEAETVVASFDLSEYNFCLFRGSGATTVMTALDSNKDSTGIQMYSGTLLYNFGTGLWDFVKHGGDWAARTTSHMYLIKRTVKHFTN
jgi:hypothetical protein